MKLKTKLTICEGGESDGDVLIIPEMIKYKGLTESAVDGFVDDVLVNGQPWASEAPESINGSYVFVCAHGSRDKRCGVCGPPLIEKFKEEVESRGLTDQVFVGACSHIGGHKYAGNLIIYSPDSEGKTMGHWYGYVAPDDVPELLDQHIAKGEVIERLWRGQMGAPAVEGEQKLPNGKEEKKKKKKHHHEEPKIPEIKENGGGCCQGVNGVSCCRDPTPAEIKPNQEAHGKCGGMGGLKSWVGSWEQREVGVPVSDVFADISAEPIAAASLGQVYKAHLHSGELVAVKVQRPGMSLRLTLDALLFHMIGGQLKRFAKARKDLLVAVNEVVRHMFDEIDYVLEARNAERFASLYGWTPGNDQMNHPSDKVKNLMGIKVPKIYWDFTRRTVLTMEWVDGIKLTDDIGLEKACLNRKELIDQGLYCSLRQLLEVGFFHADPHPGNLVALNGGYLAYFDFGMMGEIPRHYRVGLIQVLVHFVNRDALALANDFLSLGFLPDDVDIESVADALLTSFGDGTRQSQDFQAIMEQLYDVMYDFDFSLPPDYALVVRALGSLEGTAKVLDPGFKVIESSYPFVIGRLLADPNPDMRRILRELVIRDNGSIRWNRLERLKMSKDLSAFIDLLLWTCIRKDAISIFFSGLASDKMLSRLVYIR